MSVEQDFKVKVKDFEGPLELLLNLIEKRKLHISEVSLAQVADDYVKYIQDFTAGETPHHQGYAGQVANFILVASTLMLIKSLALLPTLELNPEEQQSIQDLENRLKLYQRIRELSGHIKERFGQNIIFPREQTKNQTIVFAPTHEITSPGLLAAVRSVLTNLPKKEFIPQVVVRKVMSLEEAITNLTSRIQTAMRMRFSEFVKDHKSDPADAGAARVSVIVSFLGMLELVKQGLIAVEQDSHFQEIAMESVRPDVPRY